MGTGTSSDIFSASSDDDNQNIKDENEIIQHYHTAEQKRDADNKITSKTQYHEESSITLSTPRMPCDKSTPLDLLPKIPSNIAYFNNAGKTPIPDVVQQAGINAITQSESCPWNIERPPYDIKTCTRDVRCLFAKLINAKKDGSEIAICPSTSFALTLVAHNFLRLGILQQQSFSSTPYATSLNNEKKKIVLVLQDEMSSGVYCWQEICKQCDASLEVVEHPKCNDCNDDDKGGSNITATTTCKLPSTLQNVENGEEKETYKEEEVIDGWTKAIIDKIESYHCRDDGNSIISILCIPQVHWSDGSLINLKIIGDICYKYNIKFVIDGTQSVGIMPCFDVNEFHCDVVAVSVHKWLLGPHGMSLMYVNTIYHDSWLPLDQHERSRVVFQDNVYEAKENGIININKTDDNENKNSMGYPEEFINGAARFDSGGKKNPIVIPMVKEGLETIVTKLDLIVSQKKLLEITTYIINKTKDLGFDILQPGGSRCGHILGLRVSKKLNLKLYKLLHTPRQMINFANKLQTKHNIYIAVRCGAFRISPYLNTTKEQTNILLHGFEQECKNLLDNNDDGHDDHNGSCNNCHSTSEQDDFVFI